MKKLISLMVLAISSYYCVQAQYTNPISGFPNTGSYFTFGSKSGDKYHTGLDIPASVGTSVYAVRSGQVIYNAEYDGFGSLNPSSTGGVIVIKHQDNNGKYFYAIYGHINRNSIGSSVIEGQKLGTVRSFTNGGVSVPHLHFGIYTGATFPTSGWGYSSSLTNWVHPKTYLDANCSSGGQNGGGVSYYSGACPAIGLSGTCGSSSGNTVKMDVEITGGNGVFIVKKCNGGSFTEGGIFYVKEGDICGPIFNQVSYSSGNPSKATSSKALTKGKTYYGLVVTQGGVRYYTGKFTY